MPCLALMPNNAIHGTDSQSFFWAGVIMGFKTEEEVEEWYNLEKQKLEENYLNKINKDKENIPKYRERFDADMKRLLAKYKEVYNKIIDNTDFSKKEE